MTDRWNDASPEAQNLASNFDEIDLAEMLVTAQAANARVTCLYEQWAKAGPPPLGVLIARWWDARLVELRKAIRPAPDNPAAWTPPPPGDRREQLPDHILALLDIPAYTSTACEAAKLLERQMPHALRRVELGDHADRLHARCRLQNKFTGKPCVCRCHQQAPPVPECGPACAEQHAYDWTCALFAGVDDSDPSDLTGYLAPEPGIGCLTVTAERTPSQLPGLRDQLADATVPILLDTLPKAIARTRGYEVADAFLALLYREWPWLRAVAEDATPPAAT